MIEFITRAIGLVHAVRFNGFQSFDEPIPLIVEQPISQF